MSGDGVDRSGEGRVHPTVRLLEAFYQAQADFSAGGDDTAALRRLLAETSPGMCPGVARSPATTTATARSWATSPPAGVFRIAGGEIAECWLVPFDQYLVDELWA